MNIAVKPESKVTALETAEQGITCNAICPGYVYTPLVEAQIDGQARAHNVPREKVIRDVLLAQQPNKRFATVEELGALPVSWRPPPRSPVSRCRSMEVGRRTEIGRPLARCAGDDCRRGETCDESHAQNGGSRGG